MGVLSNYCGLGGSGPTLHRVDEICKRHDEYYDFLRAKHGWPESYLTWNAADADMEEELQTLDRNKMGYKERMAYREVQIFLHSKKQVAPHHTLKKG